MRNNRWSSCTWLILAGWLGIFWIASGLPEVRAQALGYHWGNLEKYRESLRLNREDLVARGNYCPTGGCVLRLERVEVRPAKARPGQTMVLATTFTILTPEQVAIPITISREISFQGKSLGVTKEAQSRRLNGTWNQEVNFTLPANAAPGVYDLKTKISTGYSSDQKVVQFRVE